jgi:hypothetical protein
VNLKQNTLTYVKTHNKHLLIAPKMVQDKPMNVSSGDQQAAPSSSGRKTPTSRKTLLSRNRETCHV